MASLFATCLHAEELAPAQPDMALLLFLAEAEMVETKFITLVDLEIPQGEQDEDGDHEQKVDSDVVEETP